MLRPFSCVLAAGFLLSCGPGIRTKEQVQQAIINRLQTNSGLDVNALDVNTTAVTFERNMAYATISIHPKSDPGIQSMLMKYTLEDRDGKWVVTNVADSQGRGLGGHPSANSDPALPPGHPSLDGSMPANPPTSDATGSKK